MSSLYSVIAVVGMLLVLLSQCALISSNVTTEEMHKAGMRGWTRCCGLAPTRHVLNRGLLRNWYSFLTGARARQQSYDTPASACGPQCHC